MLAMTPCALQSTAIGSTRKNQSIINSTRVLPLCQFMGPDQQNGNRTADASADTHMKLVRDWSFCEQRYILERITSAVTFCQLRQEVIPSARGRSTEFNGIDCCCISIPAIDRI